jgi:hypothetical protein
MGDLQPLALPDTLDPLVVDCPARLAQQRGDLAIAIAAVLPGKLDNIGGEMLLVVTTALDISGTLMLIISFITRGGARK